METQQPKDFSLLLADIKTYVTIRIQLFKLVIIEKGAKLMADLVTNGIVAFCLLIAFLALAVTLAFYLSDLLGTYTRGFGCAAVFFMLLACLMLWKKAVVEKFIAGIAIRRYFQKHCEESAEDSKPCIEDELASLQTNGHQ